MFTGNGRYLAMALAASALLGACASSPQSQPAPSTPSAAPAAPPNNAPPNNAPRIVKSRDGKYTGEVVGVAGPDSKFAKLLIGMEPNEVSDILGRSPDRSHSYESGKRWIPFYFGNDARRTQALYKGEGCLIFTGGNIWGGGGGDLIAITFDPSGACYQP